MRNNQDSSSKNAGARQSWYARPLIGFTVGLLGLLIGILGIFIAYASLKNRELTFYVNPVRTPIVRQGETSKLRVFYGYSELRGDLIAAQVEVWNKGKESIRPVNVLHPVAIQLSSSTPILDAYIKSSTRPGVTKIVIDKKFAGDGIVTISWDILEQNDGAVLQILYSGSASLPLNVSGVIEGQKGLFQLGNPKIIIDPVKRSRDLTSNLTQAIWVIIVVTTLFVLTLRKLRPPSSSFERLMYWTFFAEISTFMIIMLSFQFRVFSPVPPLGF